MGDQIWIHLTPLHNLLGKMMEASVWTVYIRVFCTKNSINTPIYVLNLSCTKYIRVIEMRTKELPKIPCPSSKLTFPFLYASSVSLPTARTSSPWIVPARPESGTSFFHMRLYSIRQACCSI